MLIYWAWYRVHGRVGRGLSPAQFAIPKVMKLKALADVRELLSHLPRTGPAQGDVAVR